VRPDGVSLEYAAELAWENGYFPDAVIPAGDVADNYHAVTGEMLIAAIDRELAGAHVEPEDDAAYWDALEREAA
jgi:hypothetical protein